MERSFIFFILISSCLASARPTTDVANGKVAVAVETAKSNAQCAQELKSMQKVMLERLDNSIRNSQQMLPCLLDGSGFNSKFCKDVQKKSLDQLSRLETHRSSQASIDMRYDPAEGGFLLRTSALGLGTDAQGNLQIASGALTNGLDQKMQGLSADERKVFWGKHQQNLSKYLAMDWWPKQSSHYPGWENCLENRNGVISLAENRMTYAISIDRAPEKHLLFPQFKPKAKCSSLKDRECRLTQKLCQQIWDFWVRVPYGADYDRSRARRDSVQDKADQANLQPWLYNVTTAVDGKSDKEKFRIAYDAYQKLIIQAKNLKVWISKLQDFQLNKLNEFQTENIAGCENYERKGLVSLLCEDHGQAISGNRTLDECVLTNLMPINAALSLFKDLRNSEAFLTGLKNKDQWQKSHDENQKSMATSAAYAVPQTIGLGAAGNVVAKPVLAVTKKVAIKAAEVAQRPFAKRVLSGAMEKSGMAKNEITTVLNNLQSSNPKVAGDAAKKLMSEMNLDENKVRFVKIAASKGLLKDKNPEAIKAITNEVADAKVYNKAMAIVKELDPAKEIKHEQALTTAISGAKFGIRDPQELAQIISEFGRGPNSADSLSGLTRTFEIAREKLAAPSVVAIRNADERQQEAVRLALEQIRKEDDELRKLSENEWASFSTDLMSCPIGN